jgi:hypothetical protein
MAERGGSHELDRDGAARAVAILSLREDGFLNSLREDPESTLWNYGFALSPLEMETIRQAFGTARDRGMSDEDIVQMLRESLRESLRADEVEAARRWPW